MHYKKILIATDLSEYTRKTIDKALALAKTFDAEIALIHVIEPMPAFGYPELMDLEGSMREEATKLMKELATEYHVKEDNLVITMGSVRMRVLEAAKKLAADLIIVGSHGKHGWMPTLGSSTGAIVNGAECDVLMIRTEVQES